jgi:RND superfamily putative drug exporter
MAAPLSTATLARASARHPLRVVSIWVVVLLLAGIAGSGLQDVLTTEAEFTSTPESVRAADLLEARLRGPDPVTETVIVRSDSLTVDDPAFQTMIEQVTADLLAMPDIVATAVNVYQAERLEPATAAGMVSADRHTSLIAVTLDGELEAAHDDADAFLATIERRNAGGFTVLTGGDLSSSHEFKVIAEADLQQAEIFGLPVAVLVLVLVFGALVAAGVPILLALVSVFVALGLAALVGQVLDLSFYVVNMITMIGLAVGIDYTLFILQRYREERLAGHAKLDAITLAGGSSSKAVLVSGITVVLALSGMLLLPINLFRSLGAGAVLVVIVAVAGTLTLVPAILGLLGDQVDMRFSQVFQRMIRWPVRKSRRSTVPGKLLAGLVGVLVILPLAPLVLLLAAFEFILLDLVVGGPARLVRRLRRPSRIAQPISSSFWARVTCAVMARPLVSVGVTLVILIAATLPYADLKKGVGGAETLPASDIRTAVEILQRDFYVGRMTPVEIVVDGRRSERQVRAAIDQVVAAMQRDPLFGPATITSNQAGDLTLIAVPLKTDANAPTSYAAVRWLREELLPQSFAATSARAYVGGTTAMNADFAAEIDAWTPRIFAFVLSLSFVLLLLAFRSVVVPAKAIIMNLLSVGAAYGLLVLVFQKGYGADLLGFQQTPTIEPWVPIFLFCVLFGLSMDYQVFLLSRIREHYDQTHDNRAAVATGLQTTGRIITGAALIMVVVFSAFAAGDLVMFQQLGFGEAIAIFLDATLVRSVLVPATMALLGSWNWYLPTWLRWLPDLRVEAAPARPPASPVP